MTRSSLQIGRLHHRLPDLPAVLLFKSGENFLKGGTLMLFGVGYGPVNPPFYLGAFLVEGFLFCLPQRGSASSLPLQ